MNEYFAVSYNHIPLSITLYIFAWYIAYKYKKSISKKYNCDIKIPHDIAYIKRNIVALILWFIPLFNIYMAFDLLLNYDSNIDKFYKWYKDSGWVVERERV